MCGACPQLNEWRMGGMAAPLGLRRSEIVKLETPEQSEAPKETKQSPRCKTLSPSGSCRAVVRSRRRHGLGVRESLEAYQAYQVPNLELAHHRAATGGEPQRLTYLGVRGKKA